MHKQARFALQYRMHPAQALPSPALPQRSVPVAVMSVLFQEQTPCTQRCHLSIVSAILYSHQQDCMHAIASFYLDPSLIALQQVHAAIVQPLNSAQDTLCLQHISLGFQSLDKMLLEWTGDCCLRGVWLLT